MYISIPHRVAGAFACALFTICGRAMSLIGLATNVNRWAPLQLVWPGTRIILRIGLPLGQGSMARRHARAAAAGSVGPPSRNAIVNRPIRPCEMAATGQGLTSSGAVQRSACTHIYRPSAYFGYVARDACSKLPLDRPTKGASDRSSGQSSPCRGRAIEYPAKCAFRPTQCRLDPLRRTPGPLPSFLTNKRQRQQRPQPRERNAHERL
jgi:hypothetical protein